MKHRDLGHQVDVGILDFSKAFDTVPRKCLLSKLRLYVIEGSILQCIEAFLTNSRSQCTGGISSVPRGTVLGPLLFLLHVNDMPSMIDPVTMMRLFADNAVIYRVISTSTTNNCYVTRPGPPVEVGKHLGHGV